MANTFSPDPKRAERLANRLDRQLEGVPEAATPDKDSGRINKGFLTRFRKPILWIIAAAIALSGAIQINQTQVTEQAEPVEYSQVMEQAPVAKQKTSIASAPVNLRQKVKIERIRVGKSNSDVGEIQFVVKSNPPESLDINGASLRTQTRVRKYLRTKKLECVESSDLGEPVTACTLHYDNASDDIPYVITFVVNHREGTQTNHISDPVNLNTAGG